MKPAFRLWIICVFISLYTNRQNYFLPKREITDSIELSKWVLDLAKQLMGNYKEANQQTHFK